MFGAYHSAYRCRAFLSHCSSHPNKLSEHARLASRMDVCGVGAKVAVEVGRQETDQVASNMDAVWIGAGLDPT
jgi:hypothetical protein